MPKFTQTLVLIQKMFKAFTLFITIICCFLSGQSQLIQKGSDIDGPSDHDQFGDAVDVNYDGTIVAIGGDYYNAHAGLVQVFEWNGSAWIQMGVDINGEYPDDWSGWALDLDSTGTTVIIGAVRNSDGGSQAGHARVFEWDGINWIQKGSDIDGEFPNDRSGKSVTINANGTRIAVGAYLNDGNGVNSGHVRIYEWDGFDWIQMGSDLDGENAGDYFGWTTKLDYTGNTLVVGAYKNIAGGHARIFEWNGVNWIQKGSDIDGEGSSDNCGSSVHITSDGNTVIIGSETASSPALNAGQARVFSWNGLSWIQQGNSLEGESSSDNYGESVSISANGNRIAIGANLNDGNGDASGHVRVFSWDGTQWYQNGGDIDGEDTLNLCGTSVNLSGNGSSLIVGAPQNDGINGIESGHARVFEYILAPIACLVANPNPVDCGQNIAFDASCSFHEDVGKSIVNYEWDFENDGIYDAIGIVSNDTFNTMTSIKLRVTDNYGIMDSTLTIITVNDVFDPVPDQTNLPDIIAECAVTPTAPTATDNCVGTIVGIPDVAFPIENQGNTVITWTYEDGNGQIITQTQNVILTDITPPSASNPVPISVSCPSDIPAPDINVVVDEMDNCVVPTVSFVADVSDGNICNNEIITRTYSVTDDAGNQILVQQEFHILATDPFIGAGLDQTICEGDYISLTANNPNSATISWDNGVFDGVPFVPNLGTNTFTVTGEICSGLCSSNDQVSISVMTVDSTISFDGQILESNHGGSSYQWLDCDNDYAEILGATNQQFAPSSNGSYAVQISFGNCVDTSECYTTNGIGIKELSNSELFSISPNPSVNQFLITFNEVANYQVSIFSSNGSLLHHHQILNSKFYHLDIDLPSGLYYLEVLCENGLFQRTKLQIVR